MGTTCLWAHAAVGASGPCARPEWAISRQHPPDMEGICALQQLWVHGPPQCRMALQPSYSLSAFTHLTWRACVPAARAARRAGSKRRPALVPGRMAWRMGRSTAPAQSGLGAGPIVAGPVVQLKAYRKDQWHARELQPPHPDMSACNQAHAKSLPAAEVLAIPPSYPPPQHPHLGGVCGPLEPVLPLLLFPRRICCDLHACRRRRSAAAQPARLAAQPLERLDVGCHRLDVHGGRQALAGAEGEAAGGCWAGRGMWPLGTKKTMATRRRPAHAQELQHQPFTQQPARSSASSPRLTTTAKCSNRRSGGFGAASPAPGAPPCDCVYRRDHSRFSEMCSSGLKYGRSDARSRCSKGGAVGGVQLRRWQAAGNAQSAEPGSASGPTHPAGRQRRRSRSQQRLGLAHQLAIPAAVRA